MNTDHRFVFRAQEIGAESVLAAETDDVKMLFGLGPALAGSPPATRMERLLETLSPTLETIRWGEQIHGRLIASLARDPAHKLYGAVCIGRCDGLMTGESGIGVVVWTADCVPTLMVGCGVVAAIHSGWRGAEQDILGAAVTRFRTEYGVPASQIEAFLGPSISGTQYPVGPEVIEALARHEIDDATWRHGNHVDLRRFLDSRLRDLGLRREAISHIGPCTASSPQLASYRRDGTRAGRQFSLVYRTVC
jgi:YfiH family protein